jgi:hypothetical protein
MVHLGPCSRRVITGATVGERGIHRSEGSAAGKRSFCPRVNRNTLNRPALGVPSGRLLLRLYRANL